ncbi:MAG: glucose-1-phosphate adenylyltransferase subunit GlgD [Halanaerobiaceae bacterium]
MKGLLGVINLDHEQDYLNELTYFRCGASVPFAGRYRMIDFVISNMINSNIDEIAVFVRNKYRSLLDHLGEGKQWNLDKKRGGLFILPPDWHDPGDISQGDLRHFHNNMDFFHRGAADYVLHCGSQHICNIDFRAVLDSHIKNDSEVTLIYKNVSLVDKEHQSCYRLVLDNTDRVVDINNEPNNKNIYMNMFIINKDLLMDLARDCIVHQKDYFFRDAIMNRLDELDVRAYSYDGYHTVINSIESYYKNSLDLLNIDNYRRLFLQNNRIYTKVKDEVPTKYLKNSSVTNSLVANGCEIEGEVKNSIIFREVEVKEGTNIENSIIMEGGVVGEDCSLRNAILDKEVRVNPGQELMGSPEKPYVVAKRRNI